MVETPALRVGRISLCNGAGVGYYAGMASANGRQIATLFLSLVGFTPLVTRGLPCSPGQCLTLTRDDLQVWRRSLVGAPYLLKNSLKDDKG